MEINKILSSSYLDIIFDGRNKDYGAYELRRAYNLRLAKALIAMTLILLLLITGYLFANSISDSPIPKEIIKDVVLVEVKHTDPKPEVVILPKPKPEPVKVKAIIFTPPVITKDDITEDMRPPQIDKLEFARIGVINQDGVKDEGIDNPPVADNQRGIISTPGEDNSHDKDIFRKVEIESSYPGGSPAWMRYLNKTFRYPGEAQEANLQGTIVVQFIVDVEGNVSDVEAISGPVNGGLREEAIRVIKKSGRWDPAIQNGRKVKSYKKQPITFQLQAE